jgi:serine/threonine protein phosphatase PrpC
MTKNNLKILCALILCAPTAVCAMDVSKGLEALDVYPQLRIGFAQDKGGRKAQEDSYSFGPYVVAVFDGHGVENGGKVSEYAAININNHYLRMREAGHSPTAALKHSLADIEQTVLGDFQKFGKAGSTVVAAAFEGNQVHVGWMGDSKGLIFDQTPQGFKLRCETNSHTPARRDHAERVWAAGGSIRYASSYKAGWQMAEARCVDELPSDFFSSGKYWTFTQAARSSGLATGAMMTCALGDADLKKHKIMRAEPEFLEPQIFDGDSLLVLASDALTDAFTIPEFIQQLNKFAALSADELQTHYEARYQSTATWGHDQKLRALAKVLGHQILKKEKPAGLGNDNMTLMLIQLAQNQDGK